MNLLKLRSRKTDELNDIAPTSTFRTWNAFLIGHPNLVFDHLNISFRPSKAIPRDAQFILGFKPTVVLFYAPDNTELPKAEGTIPRLETPLTIKRLFKFLIGKRDKTRDEIYGFVYLTAEHVSTRKDQQEQAQRDQYEKTPKSFVEGVGQGQIWADPEDMGPIEFGGQLQLKALVRQQTKGRNAALAEQLDKSMKWMFAALVAAIVFVILLIVTGSN